MERGSKIKVSLEEVMDGVKRFHRLKKKFDGEHGEGSTIELIQALDVGRGMFQEELDEEISEK